LESRGGVTILCYHTVEERWQSPLAVTPEAFTEHCAWLAHHRQVIGVPEALKRLGTSAIGPKGVTTLTFDDGFSGVYTNALPLLQRWRFAATVFLVAETLTQAGRPIDWSSTRPSDARTLSRDEVLEMQQAGVTFGSHSYSHYDLTTLSEEECLKDLRLSRELLEDLLGRKVDLLAYPFGHHNEHVRRAAKKAGFAWAFSLPEHRESEHFGRYAVPRVVVVPGNGTMSLRIKTSRSYLQLRANPLFPVLRTAARKARLGLRVSN
jgi:peptidoglycan/xylan/chitin deacetylase (PgdA/CDA1 family)